MPGPNSLEAGERGGPTFPKGLVSTWHSSSASPETTCLKDTAYYAEHGPDALLQ